MKDRAILISNGFNRFQMAVAAAEMEKRGRLAMMITGAYPTRRIERVVSMLRLTQNERVSRLLDRKEAIPEDRIHSLVLQELTHECRRFWPMLDRFSYRSYARAAVAHVRAAFQAGARLYHYRGGFGHESVVEAKRLGIITLCEYSIAHHSILGALVKGGGRFPARATVKAVDALWRDILADVEQADHVLVNSDFVAATFAHMGWPSDRLSVVYRGVDGKFLTDIPKRKKVAQKNTLRLLFAGAFGIRKGAPILLEALNELHAMDWQLHIAGTIEPEIMKTYGHMLSSTRVSYLGNLSRRELSETMADADLFVFPSLAEGSARVVFEALACGLPVVTTPNAGSVVEHGVHGWLVSPGDPKSLGEALRVAMAHRPALRSMGKANAKMVARCYTQHQYGDNLEAVYDRLLRGVQA